MGWLVCDISSRKITEVRSQPVAGYWCSRIWFPHSSQICGFKSIWSRHLVKQLWPLTDVGGQRGGCQHLSQRKGCVLSTQQERSLKWIGPSERWWREERLTRRENLWLPAIGTWGYPIRAYKWLGAMIVMFPACKAPGPHSSISEEFLHSAILRPMKPLGSWNLVNPLLIINEAWANECAAKLHSW